MVAVGGTVVVAISAAMVVPGALTGAHHERDAVAVVWSASTPGTQTATSETAAVPARAFEVYRRNNLEVAEPVAGAPAQLDERSYENRPSTCGPARTAWPARARPGGSVSACSRGPTSSSITT